MKTIEFSILILVIQNIFSDIKTSQEIIYLYINGDSISIDKRNSSFNSDLQIIPIIRGVDIN